MKLAIFNGSPRGITSNTNKLLKYFRKGFENSGGEISSINFLISEKHLDEQVECFMEAEEILLAFPLYTDSVPGVVKQFIEKIGNFDGSSKKIAFFVHSGFPEAIHCEALVRYLELLTKRWNMQYIGTILKPGSEQIRVSPDKKNEKLFKDFELLGSHFAATGKFDNAILDKFKQLYVFPKRAIPVMRILKNLGMFDKMWTRQMKKNRVLKNSFDTPLLN